MKNEKREILTEILVTHIQDGRKSLVGDLVNLWHNKFVTDAYFLVKDSQMAQDIIQDSWITIIEKLPKLRDPGAFVFWSRRIIYNKCMDSFRTRQKIELPIEEEDIPDSREDIIKKIIKELPEMEKQMIRWYYYEDLSISEIAGLIKIPEGTVKSRLFTIRMKMKQQLNNQRDEKR